MLEKVEEEMSKRAAKELEKERQEVVKSFEVVRTPRPECIMDYDIQGPVYGVVIEQMLREGETGGWGEPIVIREPLRPRFVKAISKFREMFLIAIRFLFQILFGC